MKKMIYWPALIILALLGAGYCMSRPEQPEPLDIRVMTFNIRTGLAPDGDNRWDMRKAFVCDVIRQCAPDVFGVQEACRFQLDEFNTHLPEYGEVGIGRDGGTEGEYSAILYRTQRFEVKESGTFWLSDTPEIPSVYWGNHYRRICTWARFTDKKSARAFYVYNTHLDHRSQLSREESVQLIMKHIEARAHPDLFILTGDFNAGEDNPIIGYLKGTAELRGPTPIPLIDSFRALHPSEQTVGTGNGFKGQLDGPKIDGIFITPDIRVLEAAIVRTSRDGRTPSDHFQVTAHLQLPIH
jgi:endonuclease/exonuclease/phosphatase family metal-dependent hydrolase